MTKRVPSKDELEQDYIELLSVRRVANKHGISHSTVWKRIGPVLGKKSSVRRHLAEIPKGVSVREWARMNGVSPSTVCYWRKKCQQLNSR